MAQPGDDWPPLAVDVPDDARELDRDVAAYHREQRSQRRRARVDRVFLVDRWRRYGLAGPIGVGILVIVAAVGSLLALFVPTTGTRTAPALPLAASEATPGEKGALLPDVPLKSATGESSFTARSLRPAIVALLPADCDCAALVRNLAGQATEFGLRLVLVTADNGQRDSVTKLATEHGATNTSTAYDAAGALAEAYQLGATPVAVLVHGDGIVEGVVAGVTAQTRLEHRISDLEHAAGSAAA